MAKTAPVIPLSPMVGGLNRFDGEATAVQTVDAVNVWNKTGDLERRPAFRCIASGAPYLLPAGKMTVMTWNGVAWTTIPSRGGTIDLSGNVGDVLGGEGLAIGCNEPFDGIDFPLLATDSLFATAVDTYRWLKPRYVIGAALNEGNLPAVPWFLDTTLRTARGTFDGIHTMAGTGRITWHRDWYPAWGRVTLNGIFNYWIILDMSAAAPDPDNPATVRTSVSAALSSPITISTPGLRGLLLEPVEQIVPVHNNMGGALLTMSARQSRRGQEAGAQMGLVEQQSSPTKIMALVEDEGSGSLGQVTVPTWAGGTTTQGSPDKVVKSDQTYNWRPQNAGTDHNGDWGGQSLLTGIVPIGSLSTTGFRFTPNLLVENLYEDMVIVCTTSGGGPALAERRRITSCVVQTNDLLLTVSPAWSAAPTGSSRFKILSPPFQVRTVENDISPALAQPQMVEMEAEKNDEHSITFEVALDDRLEPSELSINQRFVNFEVCKELRWTVPGLPWDSTFDSITRQILLTNGPSGILTLDGRRLRRLEASASENDPRVQDWMGTINDLYRRNNLPTVSANSFLLSAPPLASHILDFMGRIVTSYGPRIRWTAPGAFNDIWPRVYETLIRDASNSPVVGLARLGGRVLAYTPNAVFASEAPGEDGFFAFQPVVTGMGFVSHRAVTSIPAGSNGGLVGCNADGIYLYDGGSMRPLVENWEQVIDGGVNKGRMSQAVAAVSKFDNLFFAAVPSLGSKTNNKVVVYDFAARATWVWDAPFDGISSMATGYDTSGRETVYFGTTDGHVAILANRTTDDSVTITGRARTAPVILGRGTLALQSLLVTIEDTGSRNMTVRTFLNGQADARQSWGGPFGGGGAILDSFNWDAADWAARSNFRTRKINLPNASRAEVVQVELEGTGKWKLRKMELNGKLLAQRSR